MSWYVFSVTVAAPREAVFDLWVNLDRMPEWTEGVSHVTDVTGQPGAAGTRYTVWFGRRSVIVEILQAERPRSVASRVKAGPLTADISASFEEDGARTRLTETIKTEGLIGWVWGRVLATGSFRGSFRGELATFARICELDQVGDDRRGDLGRR